MSEKLPMAELVRRTKETYRLTWQDMAEQVGRSDRMLRKIARGETSGETFRQSLTELYERGQVETLPPRRRTKDGKLARVRSKRGAGQKSVTPADTRGKYAPTVKRGRFSHSMTALPEGNRLHHIDMPRTRRSEGRKKGLEAFDTTMLKIAKSQARADKRVKVSVTVEDEQGHRRQYQIGSKSGFHASDVRSDIRTDHGGSPEGWFQRQLDAVYPDTGSYTVVGVDINEHNAARSKEIRKQEDATRTRRRRWSR